MPTAADSQGPHHGPLRAGPRLVPQGSTSVPFRGPEAGTRHMPAALLSCCRTCLTLHPHVPTRPSSPECPPDLHTAPQPQCGAAVHLPQQMPSLKSLCLLWKRRFLLPVCRHPRQKGYQVHENSGRPKEHDTFPVTEPKAMGIYEFHDKEFKIVVFF